MKTKRRVVYEVIVKCNTAEQQLRIEQMLQAVVIAQQMFMRSPTGINYRKCDIHLTRVNPLERLVEPTL